MAERPYTIVAENRHPSYCIVVRWVLFSGDTGQPFDGVEFPDKTVHMTGTFGAAVVMQGSNQLPTPTSYFTLTDPLGNNISMTAEGGEAIMENPYWIRPSAGAITEVTVTLVCAQSRR